ncbi:MAG: PilZ domain-containing protein [gamma proteobacterium endosymbiont of Lamellibrachia anaximandri]|nr:PilZ domain-containing protein [gamma proteobacterium endosymbiont of Lamellibrachia anaximandri]MBL3532534.1 PilZ domain-containing protein [gamma proteobacterium endosymbiont of Lamellibrachia anaximandri]MBL3598655.1 PilZ domain-containing protein [gamma proteobacterium endosymbiont of Lamellibrachia anaximandri]
MVEHRILPRKIANEVLEVLDQITATYMGQVVNITVEGFMLLSANPIKTGSIYQLDMRLPYLVKGHSKISFGAEALWCSEAAQPDTYWTGFRIIDISDEVTTVIDTMIMDWASIS